MEIGLVGALLVGGYYMINMMNKMKSPGLGGVIGPGTGGTEIPVDYAGRPIDTPHTDSKGEKCMTTAYADDSPAKKKAREELRAKANLTCGCAELVVKAEQMKKIDCYQLSGGFTAMVHETNDGKRCISGGCGGKFPDKEKKRLKTKDCKCNWNTEKSGAVYMSSAAHMASYPVLEVAHGGVPTIRLPRNGSNSIPEYSEN